MTEIMFSSSECNSLPGVGGGKRSFQSERPTCWGEIEPDPCDAFEFKVLSYSCGCC